MKRVVITAAILCLALAADPGAALGNDVTDSKWGVSPSQFRPVGTFDVIAGNGSSVAEIVDASPLGQQLVYTDSGEASIGFVNITIPSRPVGQGTVFVGGEPTSLAVLDPWVLVAVNTSPDFVNPSGKLVVVNRLTRWIAAEFDLGGQPDSIAVSPDHKYAAIAIENERDEDLGDGLLPQLPSGKLLIFDLRGLPWRWNFREADLSPVIDDVTGGADLETEYVDINRDNEAVVTFQENNWLAIVDLETGMTISSFPAGSVELTNVDTEGNDLIELNTTITKRCEPDGVAWIDDDSFAIACEGDYEDQLGEKGGSRGFTIFNQDGTVEYEAAESFEHWLVSAGHYNEDRSENKGCEPEGVEVGVFSRWGKAAVGASDEAAAKRGGGSGTTLMFVNSERCNAIGVYDVSNGVPEPLQILPTGIEPEGVKAIPGRNLLVASTENNESADVGIPTMINIYRAAGGDPYYPTIVSVDSGDGTPIPWVALSGLVGDPTDADTLYAVSDSFLAAGFIYTIDTSIRPAKIIDRLQVTGATADLDLEGIAVGPDGHFWLGSEGDAGSRPNLVLEVDPDTGAVLREIELPADLVDQRRGNGIEGIAVAGEAGSETVYVAIQRAWPKEGDTDGVNTKIGRYEVGSGVWGFVHYPLEPQGQGDWIGLSELTLLPDGTFAVIERDKGWGPSTGFIAELKAIYGVDLESAEFRAFNDPSGLVTIDKQLLRDVLPDLEDTSIWTAEKLEGLAVSAAPDENVYLVVDNDGVDGATGETLFLELGHWMDAFDN